MAVDNQEHPGNEDESEADAEKPKNFTEAILRVFEEDYELLERALNSKHGYTDDALAAVKERWGEDMIPASGTHYISSVKSKRSDELQTLYKEHPDAEDDTEADEDTETESDTEPSPEATSNPDDGMIAELSAAAAPSNPTTDEERCKAVILQSADLREQAMSDDLGVKDVVNTVADEYGPLYKPAESTANAAIASLRSDIDFDTDYVSLDQVDAIARIVYVCQLCGEEGTDKRAMMRHVSQTTDELHNTHSGQEFINATARPAESSHEVFDTEAFREHVGPQARILEAVYLNPTSAQDEIATMLGVSTQAITDTFRTQSIPWDERQQGIETMLEQWDAGDLDVSDGEITITLSESEARAALCEDAMAPVKRALLDGLL